MTTERFFVVVPPGLEILAAQELSEKIPGLAELGIERGGFTVEAPFEIGLALNAILKIPSAILLRIADFKCRDLPKLYNKVSNIRWGRYLVGSDFVLSVACSKSRLLNEKKVAKSVTEGIERHFQKQPPKKTGSPFPFEIHVRFFNDVCTLSLNTSGDLLFKRGYKKLSAVAPLRENLAAGLYYGFKSTVGEFDALVDPMCGSGTFLLEAAAFWQKSMMREYAFQKKEDWRSGEISLAGHSPGVFYGLDRDEQSLKDLQMSAAALPLSHERQWHFSTHDILEKKPIPVFSEKIKTYAFICNPPYGERLALAKPPQQYYPELIAKMIGPHPAAAKTRMIFPLGIGIILPKKFSSLVPSRISGYTVKQEWSFENGGLPVIFRVYKK